MQNLYNRHQYPHSPKYYTKRSPVPPRFNNISVLSLFSLIVGTLILSIYLNGEMAGAGSGIREVRRAVVSRQDLDDNQKSRKVENIPRSSIDQIEHAHQQSHAIKTSQEPKPYLLQPQTPTNKTWNNFAIALKTGRQVSSSRVPIQLVTFLSDVEKLLIIGESEGIVGGIIVNDVYSGLYDDDRSVPKIIAPKLEPRSLKAAASSSNSIIVDKQSIGWQSDAHKNLPGFKLLYERYPDTEWYVMIDDDTYIVLENLEEYVNAHFPDPDELVYLGNPNHFIGCDGVKKMGDGILFGHGGSGIVVSRGAMKLMIEGIEECILKYRTCWAGDVRTALCLRDNGVLLNTGIPLRFNSEPPNSLDGYWPRDPCIQPFTFHHLLPWQIQTLYNIQIQTRKRSKTGDTNSKTGMTYADILQEFSKEEGVVAGEKNWKGNSNRPGMDYKTVMFQGAKSDEHAAAECHAICVEEASCRSWSFDGDKCWLKDGIAKAIVKNGAFSGVDYKEYACS